jgi:aminopeptidase N
MTNFQAKYRHDYQVPDYFIKTIDLTVELDDEQTRVVAELTVIRHGEHQKPLVLDGEELTLKSLHLNQQRLTAEEYIATPQQLIIHAVPEQFTLTIETEINPAANTALEGLYKSGDAFCTQCEAEGFRRITYYLDRPDVMAIFTCKIIADKARYPYLLSNGNKIAEGDLADGKHFAKWHDPHPKPCYLFALVAGDFDVLTDSYTTIENRDVSLVIYVDRGNLNKAHHAMASLKKSMQWDEQTFGLAYDLDIYMIVAVDFFNMGAMENKGLNIFNSKYVLADTATATDTDYFNIESVIAHEYFHNWTGNRVTCRDWFQLSLKEGLTVFRDQQFSADQHSAAVCRIQNVRLLRSMQFPEDAGPMAHPIRPDKVMEMNNFYTLTVYEKGAEVIRMIHTLLGSEGFRKGMDCYFERFDGMAVTCDDFVNAMADASGVDLTQFKRWYSQSGTPILAIESQWHEELQLLQLTLRQINEPTKVQPEKYPLHIPVKMEFFDPTTGQHQTHLFELKKENQVVEITGFSQQPIIVPLVNFSAPVKVNFSQTPQDWLTIMRDAHDAFSRWDATQQLFTFYIKQLVEKPNTLLPQVLFDSIADILASAQHADKAFIAEQLTLPSFDEVLAEYAQVDPIKVATAHKQFFIALAQHLKSAFLECYQHCLVIEYHQDAESVGKRALKNLCLRYLAVHHDMQYLIAEQYQQSTNMTDSLGALQAAKLADVNLFDDLMQQFEQQWQHDNLVMDKWFSLAATLDADDGLERIQRLLVHPLFSLKNPNRARSVLGAFGQQNPRVFHQASGKGYQLLAEQIALIDKMNPQVASRLITPLIQFGNLDDKRQQLIKQALHQLHCLPGVSRDLSEKLSASLD